MKKKSNSTYRARLNARGYEQVDGEHYDEDSKASPVVQAATIRIVLTLILMMGWYAILMDQGSIPSWRVRKGSQSVYGSTGRAREILSYRMVTTLTKDLIWNQASSKSILAEVTRGIGTHEISTK